MLIFVINLVEKVIINDYCKMRYEKGILEYFRNNFWNKIPILTGIEFMGDSTLIITILNFIIQLYF